MLPFTATVNGNIRVSFGNRRVTPIVTKLKTSLFHLANRIKLSSLKRSPTHPHYIGGDAGK
jgi:hypothetical protein